jgi:hypothetical protein
MSAATHASESRRWQDTPALGAGQAAPGGGYRGIAKEESMAEKRDLLRHTVATLAYRAAKTLRGVPEGFGGFRAGPTSRSAGEIVAHLGDLLDWALELADGRQTWRETPAGEWPAQVDRFFAALRRFDERLAAPEPLAIEEQRLFQGPVADALTHVGQIALLRRLAGGAQRGENYLRADIVAGRVGAEQTAPKREFD